MKVRAGDQVRIYFGDKVMDSIVSNCRKRGCIKEIDLNDFVLRDLPPIEPPSPTKVYDSIRETPIEIITNLSQEAQDALGDELLADAHHAQEKEEADMPINDLLYTDESLEDINMKIRLAFERGKGEA